jgi:hypothetical protein
MRHIQTPYKIRTFGTGFPKPITAVHTTPRLRRCEFGPKWNPEEKKDRGKWNPATWSNNYLPDITSSHDDVDYNEIVNEKTGKQILRIWRSFEMDETPVTLCEVRKTFDQGIGTTLAKEQHKTTLEALRSLPGLMFAAWFALRNTTSL